MQCATDYLLSGRPLHELCDHNYKASGQWVSVFSGVQSGRENGTVQQTMGVFNVGYFPLLLSGAKPIYTLCVCNPTTGDYSLPHVCL